MAKYRYRYILPNTNVLRGTISDFPLYTANKIGPMHNLSIRVRIPEEVQLSKRSYANYSVIENDPRTIEDFDYDVLVKFDSKWKVQNQLKGKTFYQMVCELKKGGYEELEMYGWLTKLEYMKTLGQIRRINQRCEELLRI